MYLSFKMCVCMFNRQYILESQIFCYLPNLSLDRDSEQSYHPTTSLSKSNYTPYICSSCSLKTVNIPDIYRVKWLPCFRHRPKQSDRWLLSAVSGLHSTKLFTLLAAQAHNSCNNKLVLIRWMDGKRHCSWALEKMKIAVRVQDSTVGQAEMSKRKYCSISNILLPCSNIVRTCYSPFERMFVV